MATPDVTQRQTRRVYSTDQLHRLRGTVSTPKLNESIEEHDGNEADLIKAFMECCHDLSPHAWQQHQQWVDSLVESPSKAHVDQEDHSALTLLQSPTEHVLRGSKSFAARSWKSRGSGQSLRIPSNKENRAANLQDSERPSFSQHASALAPILGEIAANNQNIIRTGPYGRARRSPTPSLKRKKVEAIVRAHGSPTHVRVTAGGRIVPSEQSPLCHPRYGYSAIKTNGGLIKFAPNHPMGKSQWTQATQNGFVAQDADGRLCQIVDGTILLLKEIEGALQLYMPAPNLNVTQRTSSIVAASQSHMPQAGIEAPITLRPGNPIMPKPSVHAQINALELEYSKLEHELKDVDKTEVMHGRTMGKVSKDALIAKRRELVTTLDNVRKALKSLKQQSLATDVPVPSSALHDKRGSSPVFSRLPPFLQPRHPNQELSLPTTAPAAVYGHFLGQHPPFVGPYGFGPNPSPEPGYSAIAWAIPPPSLFAPPPPFDGSVSGITLQTQPASSDANATSEAERQQSAQVKTAKSSSIHSDNVELMGVKTSRSPQRIISPPQFRTLPVKATEQKPAQLSRSNLNPMSPEYKPLHDSPKKCTSSINMQSGRAEETPSLLPMDDIKDTGARSRDLPRVAQNSQETVGPSTKNIHLQSSSVSSFETADFFPRNTHEYSTRQHNPGPNTIGDNDHNERSPGSSPEVVGANRELPGPSGAACKSRSGETPAAPPGTPVGRDAKGYTAPLPVIVDGSSWDRKAPVLEAPADREVHNVSPKAKRREWRFVEEHPDREQIAHFSSPTKEFACADELCVNNSPQDIMDFSDKSRDWIEGYQAGLNRHPVGSSRMGDFLDGYCSGLLKSSPSSIGHSTGSPTKPVPRRPSPVPNHPRACAVVPLASRVNAAVRPTLSPQDCKAESLHALKQAVLAPHNENAVLTPAADGLHVNEANYNLGAWAKQRSVSPTLNKPLPSVALSAEVCEHDEKTLGMFQAGNSKQLQPPSSATEAEPSSPTMSAKSLASSNLPANSIEAHRVNNIANVESRLYRQWPGSRVVSPNLEWKSGSSVSHQTGLATGFFAHAQIDGKYRLHRAL
nr:hypothetical protein CFP56_72336 [Quercus suber]